MPGIVDDPSQVPARSKAVRLRVVAGVNCSAAQVQGSSVIAWHFHISFPESPGPCPAGTHFACINELG